MGDCLKEAADRLAAAIAAADHKYLIGEYTEEQRKAAIEAAIEQYWSDAATCFGNNEGASNRS
jgi:hypothetical protein